MQAKISRHREERSLDWLTGEELLDFRGVIEQYSHGVRFERPDFLLTFSDANLL